MLQEPNKLTSVFNNHAEEWNLDAEAIAAAVELASKDKLGTSGKKRKRSFTPPSKQLLFLYAKGLMAKESSLVRKAKFKEVLEGATPEMQKARERLNTIVLKGEIAPTRTQINPPTQFELFIQMHPEWYSGWVAHRDHPDLKGYF